MFKFLHLPVFAFTAVILLGSASHTWAQEPGTLITVLPEDLPEPYATDSVANGPDRVKRAKDEMPRVPDGFKVSIFAEDLDDARWMAVAPNGDVFLAEPDNEAVTVLRDADGDGKAEARDEFAGDFDNPHGLAFGHGGIYVADTQAVWWFPYQDGDMTARGERVQVTPDGALGDRSGHWTRNIALSPDGRTLYVSIGSRSNIAEEAEPRATIQVFTLAEDGRNTTAQKTFASGLRNPVGIALRPGTEEVWTVVNERDGMGDELVPDYLTQVQEGQFYGWPYAYIGPNPQPEYEGKAPEKVAATAIPDVLFESHSAALGLAFYDGDTFPEDMQGDAFIGLHGSWNAIRPRGYAVARVDFENGRPSKSYELFATGFWRKGEDKAEVWGRPVGIAVARDGALLVADDVAQVVWRIQAE